MNFKKAIVRVMGKVYVMSICRKTLAVFTSLCFLFNDIIVEHAEATELSSSLISANEISIPANIGTIKDVFQGTSAKTVVHIQDAHCNRFAQEKINEILSYLYGEYGINNINPNFALELMFQG